MKYDKIIKWVLVALFAIGALLSVLGFAIGFDANGDAPVDIMLYCAYAYALVAIVAVLFGVVVIGGMNEPKSLIKLGIGIAAIVVIVVLAWLLAPGTPAVVAGGMKVALITTVGGLIVAAILQIFYNYILSQVEALTIQMEDASISLMDILVKYQDNK